MVREFYYVPLEPDDSYKTAEPISYPDTEQGTKQRDKDFKDIQQNKTTFEQVRQKRSASGGASSPRSKPKPNYAYQDLSDPSGSKIIYVETEPTKKTDVVKVKPVLQRRTTEDIGISAALPTYSALATSTNRTIELRKREPEPGYVREYDPGASYFGRVESFEVPNKTNISLNNDYSITGQLTEVPLKPTREERLNQPTFLGITEPSFEPLRVLEYRATKRAEAAEQRFLTGRKGFGESALLYGASTPLRLVNRPISSTVTGAALITGTEALSSPILSTELIGGGILGDYLAVGLKQEEKEGRSGARTTGETGFFGSFLLAPKAYELGRGEIVRFKAQKVPPEEVFSSQVLEGKQFPTSKTAAESLKRFREAKGAEGFEVSHVTSNRIPKDFSVDIIKGTEGAKGLEDPGLYVTPKGEASPYFLRGERGKGFDLFPKFRDPTTVEIINIKNVRRYPKKVLESEGFGEVFEYGKDFPGEVFVTKRSELGLGSIKEKGVSGTSELEGVVTVGTELKEVGSRRYTLYEGDVVRLREYKVTGNKISQAEFIKQVNEIGKSSSSSIGASSRASISQLPLSVSSYFSGKKSSSILSDSSLSRSFSYGSSKSSTSSSKSIVSSGKSLRSSRVSSGKSYLSTSSSFSELSRRISRTTRTPRASSSFRLPPPPKINLDFKNPPKKKKKGKGKRVSRDYGFSRSVVGLEFGLKPRKQKLFTGVEIR